MSKEENKKDVPASPGASRLDDGGPAFARPHSLGPAEHAWDQQGMSLRDYFAIRILAADISTTESGLDGYRDFAGAAKNAYKASDAMLAARAEGRTA